jgi:hypothetical protein
VERKYDKPLRTNATLASCSRSALFDASTQIDSPCGPENNAARDKKEM